MNVYSAQKFIVRVCVVLLVLFGILAVYQSVHALSDNSHPSYTGGSECHAYNTGYGVIVPVYDYCHSDTKLPAGNVPVAKHKRHGKNLDTVSPVVTPPHGGSNHNPGDDNPEENHNHHDHGNHYGNDKGDNNCKDTKNKHNTCKPDESSVGFALFVAVMLLGKQGKVIRMDGVRDVSRRGNTVTVSKNIGDDIVFYDVKNAVIQSVYLSESSGNGSFIHTDDKEWNEYLRES